MILTREIVDIFIKNHLGILDYETLLQKDKLEFLKLIVKSHNLNIYFQNADMAATPVKDRHVPTIPELVECARTGSGGNCFTLNYFMKMLLVYLGYDAYSIAGTMSGSGSGSTGNHVMAVVRFSENEEYLVDVASGNPLLEPVPLHALPFSGSTAGDFTFEFRKISDKLYARFQVGGSLFHGPFKGDTTEVPRFEFNLTPLEYEQFIPAMKEIWTDETKSPFYRSLFLFRYFYPTNENKRISDVKVALSNPEEPRFVLIYGSNFLIGGKGIREVTRFCSYAEMMTVINKYFPKLKIGSLHGAIAFLEKHSQFEPGLMD